MYKCKLCEQIHAFQSMMFTHLRDNHGSARKGLMIEI